MRVLVLDCYLDDVGGARNLLPGLGDCDVLRPAHESLPERLEADALVVTGSAASVLEPPQWLAPLEARVGDALGRGAAVLGVCFGHQVLARVLWGPDAVRRSPFGGRTGELGWTEIEVQGDDPLLAGVPRRFPCFVSHADEVDPAHVPAGTRVLARSEGCAVQAFRAGERPAWGVQFHAEMGASESEELVRARAERHGLDAERLLAGRTDTSAVIARLLANFGAAARAR